MPRTAIHPIVAPVLICIWLLLMASALGKRAVESRQQQAQWLQLASMQADLAELSLHGGWAVIHRPTTCSCNAARMERTLAALSELNLKVVAVGAMHASHDLIIVAPDGRVTYAGSADIPIGSLCSASARTPADLLKAGWLSADIPVLDRPSPCRCPYQT